MYGLIVLSATAHSGVVCELVNYTGIADMTGATDTIERIITAICAGRINVAPSIALDTVRVLALSERAGWDDDAMLERQDAALEVWGALLDEPHLIRCDEDAADLASGLRLLIQTIAVQTCETT